MSFYTIFSKETGVQLRVISKPNASGPPLVTEGEIYRTGIFGRDSILVGGQVTQKPPPSITINTTQAKASIETITLSSIPNPTKIIITGNDSCFIRNITDGLYEFSIDVPGNYIVKCETDIELPIEFKVTIL